jgi:hypothetical protein
MDKVRKPNISEGIRWLGHVERIEDNAVPKRMLKEKAILKKKKRKTQDEMVGRC